MLAAHLAIVARLCRCLFLSCHGHPRDRVFECDDGIDRACESHLHRSAHLASVDCSGHHGAKSPHVIEVLAHPCARLLNFFSAAFTFFPGCLLLRYRFGHFAVSDFGRWVEVQRRIRALMLQVQDGFLAHVDLVTTLPIDGNGLALVVRQGDKVSDLALERDVSDETMSGLGVQPRKIAGVRIAVRIAVLHVEQQHKVVAVIQRHICSS